MTEASVCDYCGEELYDEPIRRGGFVYCCEACVFEAARSQDCGGRTDIHSSQPPKELELPDQG